jgi:DNA-binding transcriptional MerR regulator
MAKASSKSSVTKGPDAFRTIGEAAMEIGVQPHVLRFWETKFSAVSPLTRAGGRRYYRPRDMELLRTIKNLLHDQGFTIKGAQKHLQANRGATSEDRSGQEGSGQRALLLDGGPTTKAKTSAEKQSSARHQSAELAKIARALAAEARQVASGAMPPVDSANGRLPDA